MRVTPDPEAKPKLFGLSTYQIAPPLFGGSLRIYHLALGYARDFEVTYGTQKLRVPRLFRPLRVPVAPSFVEWQGVGITGAVGSLVSRRLGLPQLAYEWTLNWLPRSARRALAEADVIVLEQPWSYRWIRARRRPGQFLVASTHNVESDLFEAARMRVPVRFVPALKALVERREAEALRAADLVVCCTTQDRDAMVERYGIDLEKTIVVPNGVDTASYRMVDDRQRDEAKAAIGLAGKRVAVFAGSSHPPNVSAVREIVAIARRTERPDTHFLIVGSVGRLFKDVALPNMTFTGVVDEVRPYLESGDVFLNPTTEGSGSNVKLFEAMAAGLPTLTTAFGARGIDAVDGEHLRVAPLSEFASALETFFRDVESRAVMRLHARALVEERYDWKKLSAIVVAELSRRREQYSHESANDAVAEVSPLIERNKAI